MSLPQFNHEFIPHNRFLNSDVYSPDVELEYKELCYELQEYIACSNAVTVNDEVMFSFYGILTFREYMNQIILREHLCRSLHCYLLHKIHRSERLTKINIYISSCNPYIIEVTYDNEIYKIRYLN